MFAALLTTVFFSFSAVFAHRSAKTIGGTEANFWRAACATVLLAIWSYSFGVGLAGSALPAFVLSGVLGIGIGDFAFFHALHRLGPRLSLLLVHCLSAPLGATIEWLWLGTSLTRAQIVSGSVILLGVAIALAPNDPAALPRSERAGGLLFGVLASLGIAGGAVFSRKAYAILGASHEYIDPVNAGYQRMLGGLFLAGIWLLVAKRSEFRVQTRAPRELVIRASRNKWRSAWPWIVLNALAGQTLGVSCLQWAFETTPAGVVLPIVAMTPIVVIPLTLLMEGERPPAQSLAGSAVAVGGVVALTLCR
jgi:drug/metabolite transporter (DMT)-like permease